MKLVALLLLLALGALPDANCAMLKNSSNEQPEAAKSLFAYVKIALVIDYDYFSTIHNSDITTLVPYMEAFWHSVDRRFRALNMGQLRIGLRMVKMSIPESNAAQEVYVKKPYAGYWDWLEGSPTLAALAEFAKKQFNDNVVPVLITDKYVQEHYGMASLGSACNSSRAAAIVRDDGYFDGVMIAAQQIGHTLNAELDGYRSARACASNDFIMGPYFGTNTMRWSDCSERAIRDYLDSAESDCLFQPEPKDALPFNYLPGQVKSLQDMCDSFKGDWVPLLRSQTLAGEYYDICKSLVCHSFTETTIMELGLTLDGSTCDENKICLDGKCVKQPKP